MRHPAALSKGDAIAVFSPSGPVLEEHIASGRSRLSSWGYELLDFAPYLRHDQGFLAGTDLQRYHNFMQAWRDTRVGALWCSRGGYGAMRLLPALADHADELRETPRLLLGFSDVTALHLYLAGVLEIPTLHAPVLKSFDLQSNWVETAHAALGGRDRIELTFDVRGVAGGKAKGTALGGNLSLVASMLASPYCPDLNGKVLFLEDVGESDYRLDRLFTTLRLSEHASKPAAIVLGDFTDCADTYVCEEDIPVFVEGLASEFGCPVVADFPMGHGSRNAAIPMGVTVEVDADAGRVQFECDAVAP